MMNFKKMKSHFLAIVAAGFCCLSCVEVNTGLGSNLIPIGQTYTFHTVEIPISEIYNKMADSLSAYSKTRITVGSVHDEDYGTSKRSSSITLVPLFKEDLTIGENPIFQSFHFGAKRDTVDFYKDEEENIIQTLRVYELTEQIDPNVNFDINLPVNHSKKQINKGTILYSDEDSLSFDFTEEFAQKFLALQDEDFKDIDRYLKKVPGIYIEADAPIGNGGRINIFDIQLDYDSDYQYIVGNFAELNYSAEFDGERRDTSMRFYYGASEFYDIDSLFTNSATGSFPQYALNTTTHETRDKEGRAEDYIYVQGGGGLKPMIPASHLRELARESISKAGADPNNVIINKASLIFPFEFPENYKDMSFWPDILSPTCRIINTKEDGGSPTFMGLTDTSSDTENIGKVNRSIFEYSPDITYHMQEIVKYDEKTASNTIKQRYNNGSFDIWLLIMANEVTTTTTSGSNDMSEYYNYLAYQSYYNDMYGGYGYGGYGGYGYGSSYNNYYSYAMMAAYASQSTTTESIEVELDKDRYYKSKLCGPTHPTRQPYLKLTFAVPNE